MSDWNLSDADLSSVVKYLSDECVEEFVHSFINGADNMGENEIVKRSKFISFFIHEKRVSDDYSLKVIRTCLRVLLHRPNVQLCALIESCYSVLGATHRSGVLSRILATTRVLLSEEREHSNVSSGLALCRLLCSNSNVEFNEDITSFMIDACFRLNLTLVIKLLPPLEELILAQSDSSLLEELWKHLEENFKAGFSDESMCRSLMVLSHLGRYYVILESNKISRTLLFESSFWLILQEGLTSSKSIDRKRSLFLLKLSVETIQTSDKDIELPTFKYKVSQSDGLEALFSLCLAYDVVEESQQHMVTPIFKIIDHLTEFCEKGVIASSWLFLIFTRLFHHESFIVKRSAVISFCSTCARYFSDDSFNYQPILIHFFTACNDMMLFDPSCDSINIEKLLTHWFTFLPSSAFAYILPSLTLTRWGPIPLYHIMYSLYQSNRRSLWTNESLVELKDFIKLFLSSQNVMIRGAIQSTTLYCLFNLATDSLDINTIALLLSAFPFNETFKRSNQVWSQCTNWLKSVINEQQVSSFMSNMTNLVNAEVRIPSDSFIGTSAAVRMIVLLNDAGLFQCPISPLTELSRVLLNNFTYCEKRLYGSYEDQIFSVRFLNRLLDEAHLRSPVEDELIKTFINVKTIDVLWQFITTSFKYHHRNSVYSLDDDIEQVLFMCEHLCRISPEMIKKLFLYFPIVETPFDMDYYDFGIIELCLKHWPKDETFPHEIFQVLTRALDPRVERGQRSNTSRAWSLRYLLTQVVDSSEIEWLQSSKLIILAMNDVALGDNQTLIQILQTISVASLETTDSQLIVDFLSCSWSACFENRKSELFWAGMRWWIATAFRPHLMVQNTLKSYLKQKALELIKIGNDIIGLTNLLAKELQKSSTAFCTIDYADVIAECLVFGPLLRKDQRIEEFTCEIIRGRFLNDIVQDTRQKGKKIGEVRARALGIVLHSRDVKFKTALTEGLVQHDRQLAKESKKYFKNSEIHRKRNRLWQSLVILEPDLGNETRERLFKWLSDCLLNYSHQPSVRYLMEWLFVRICRFWGYSEQFWECFEASSAKPGSQCSFISIGFHLCRSTLDSCFFEKFIDNIISCCMSQNFNVRLYSQVALRNLWDLFPDVAPKYEIIWKNQHKVFLQGNALVNAKKMESEFYFKIFDAVKHYTLKTIFWDIPRLSNLAKDEWISYRELTLWALKFDPPYVSTLGQCDTSLDEFEAASWVPRISGNDSNDSVNMVIQKKYMPAKGHEFEIGYRVAAMKKTRGGSLVLVTSLLDKASNLGGLARSCEIFGVDQFIVGSLQCMTDKNFTSLSMTAEGQLDVREVKPFKLKGYLKDMMSQGYSLVGAEQTTGSVPLSLFTFPLKTLLLLGNEREGIPADLMSSLDSFVEIPQFGVIRSLNVHVTGAIMMWEYVKQHFI